jgi:hypothetical protein
MILIGFRGRSLMCGSGDTPQVKSRGFPTYRLTMPLPYSGLMSWGEGGLKLLYRPCRPPIHHPMRNLTPSNPSPPRQLWRHQLKCLSKCWKTFYTLSARKRKSYMSFIYSPVVTQKDLTAQSSVNIKS